MSRAIHVALLLGLLIPAPSGCSCGPKDQTPTQMKTPPKEPPESGEGDLFPKQKK